jgi:hypothetical protein
MNRGSITGGYVRKTVSLPRGLVKKVGTHLKTVPGTTISALTTVVLEKLGGRKKES